MTRTMYDSTDAHDVPAGADLYLGYIDGAYANVDELRQRFPHKPIIRTTVCSGTLDADVADIERGDYLPASGAAWAKRKEARDGYAGLYCSVSDWPGVKREVLALGVPNVWYIVAGYDNNPIIPKGAVGKQYANEPLTHGHYDASVVADYIPGVDPAPKTKASHKPHAHVIRLLRRALAALTSKGTK